MSVASASTYIIFYIACKNKLSEVNKMECFIFSKSSSYSLFLQYLSEVTALRGYLCKFKLLVDFDYTFSTMLWMNPQLFLWKKKTTLQWFPNKDDYKKHGKCHMEALRKGK